MKHMFESKRFEGEAGSTVHTRVLCFSLTKSDFDRKVRRGWAPRATGALVKGGGRGYTLLRLSVIFSTGGRSSAEVFTVHE